MRLTKAAMAAALALIVITSYSIHYTKLYDSQCVPGPGDENVCLTAVTDITDTRRLEGELLAAKHAAERASSSKSEFLANRNNFV